MSILKFNKVRSKFRRQQVLGPYNDLYKKCWCLSSLLLPLLLLSACGFHLRGSTPGSTVQVNLLPLPQQDCLTVALQRQLPRLEAPKTTLPQLTVTRNQLITSPLSYNSFNQIYQQRLNYEASFNLKDPKGTVLIPETTVSTDREQRMSNVTPMSDQQERKMIEEALCQDIAQQILWQISQYHAHHPQTTPE